MKSGTLTIEKVQGLLTSSHFDPYSSMKDRTGVTGNREYVNNVNNNNSASNITVGDIHINNPVGNSDDLAKELMMNLPNAFQKQMYTNLK